MIISCCVMVATSAPTLSLTRGPFSPWAIRMGTDRYGSAVRWPG